MWHLSAQSEQCGCRASFREIEVERLPLSARGRVTSHAVMRLAAVAKRVQDDSRGGVL